MKKPIILLLIFCISMSAVGCMKDASARAANVVAATDNISTDANKAPWPTEKWSISMPEEQGMKSGVLYDGDKKIDENYPNIYSFLVVRHGYIVHEKYYQGMSEEDSNPVFSVTKSVMSALTGIAIKEKLIEGVDQKAADLLPEYFSNVDDNRKKEITIKNILTMTGGLEPVDNDYYAYFSSRDWLDYAIKKPLIDAPGKKWAYNTGLTQLLSGIIAKTSKMSTLEYAEKNLFMPLGINDRQRWDMDSTGQYGGGSGLYLSSRNMAKLGYLYLNNGMWDGQQIIPAEWVAESTKKHLQAEPDSDYGYLFWNWASKAKSNDKTYYAYAACGAGGQYIIVVPDLDIVAVITANRNAASKDKADTADIVWNYVIAAIN